MGTIVNLFASVSGLWKKAAAFLPLLAGAGSVLVGAGNILLGLAHASDAAAMLAVIKALNPNDPNVLMVIGGLTALGIHTNHQDVQAQVAAQPQAPAPAAPPAPPAA